MPNHVINNVYAKTNVLEAMLNEELKVDFNNIVPLPDVMIPIKRSITRSETAALCAIK